jgi:hypothetical protein
VSKWRKSIKRIGTNIKKGARNVGRYAKAGAGAIIPGAGAVMGLINKDSSSDDYRSEAAGQLVKKNVSTQAGAGKINYTQEVWE